MSWRSNIRIIARSNNMSRIRQVIVKVDWRNHTSEALDTLFSHLPTDMPWNNVHVLKVVSDKNNGSLIYTNLLDVPVPLAQLTKLELAVNGVVEVNKLASICADTLKHLELKEVAGNGIWRTFANVGNGMEVDGVLFRNLEKLFVSYIPSSPSDEHEIAVRSKLDQRGRGLRLHFPKLAYLNVENCPSYSWLLNAEISSALKSVRIMELEGHIELTEYLSRHTEPVESFVVSAYIPHGDASMFYLATNRLFGGRGCAKYTALTLCNSPELLDVNLINWIQLNKLSVFTSVPAIALINVISRLPSLNDLALRDVTTDGWDRQRESDVNHEHYEPISTTITKVYYNDKDLTSDSSAPEFLKYMLLAIPNIAEFAFSNQHFHEILRFVQTLGYRSHPHLFDIRYDILYSWKHQLPFLSVCRLWRLLALPMTYSNAFISSNAYVEHTQPHNAISSYLPNLKKLVFYGEADSQPTAEFIGNLLAKYNLSEIWCNSPIKYSCCQFSTELTSLKLMFDPHGDQLLSRINASSLKYLNLYGISGEFSWHNFGHNAAGLPNKVVFGSLQSLEVAYGHIFFDEGGDKVIDRNDCHELELHFPVLSNLRILHCPPNCVLLTAGRFPKSLAQATIHGSSCIVPLLSKCTLSQVRQIAVNIHYSDHHDAMELSKSANHVFGNSRYIQNASLYLGRQAKLSSFSPSAIYWPNVTRALIMSPLAVGTLLEALNRLPNLMSLVSYRTIMSQIAGACITHASARSEKCGYKLERLGIIYITQECQEHDLETLMTYLLPRMQALTSLNVPSQHVDIFQTIVDQHGANINIKGFL
ncbi:hypothetical protein EV183_001372 [Coemansia sp. RSA 2336]|nr:hypothetical protein EV183_001372 [Coemansia sp. RSA 2336]